MSEGKVGQRGVALAISPNLIAHEIGSRSPFWIWARIIHPLFPQGLIVGSVYVIVHKGSERNTMLEGLKASIKGIIQKHPRAPLAIMGDWNMDTQELSKVLSRWNIPLKCLKTRGSPQTRWKGVGAHRDLDHIVVSGNLNSLLANSLVNRSWDLSDHWPISTFLKEVAQSGAEQAKSQQVEQLLNRQKVKEYAQAIACHNMWNVLLEEEGTDTEVNVAKFLETSAQAAKATEVTK